MKIKVPCRGPQCSAGMFALYDTDTERVFIHTAGEHDHDELLEKLERTCFNDVTRKFISDLLGKKTTIPKVIMDCLAEESTKNALIQVFC